MSWKPLNVLFIGEEPSSRNVNKNVPFVGTSSYKRLLNWIGELDLNIANVSLHNVDDVETIYTGNFDVIIFLGKKASKSLKKIIEEDEWYDLSRSPSVKIIDHPSPRNRKFNDPNYERKMLKELKEWLYG